MSKIEWIGREVREELRLRGLGPNARCVICGETNRMCLTRPSAVLVEIHHLAGRANDPKLGIHLCLNHHRILTEQMRDSGVPLEHDADRGFLEKLQALLMGVGLALVMIGQALIELAKSLNQEIGRLDHDSPGWRLPPEGA
jgi:hypothetical protein